MTSQIHRNALREGSSLLWYKIERILGQGGFGITYLACDTNLDQQVAIKEYLPMELAVREGDQSVHPVSQGHEDDFQWGLERFITEARILVRFDHPNIARVLSVFEANNTAYLVMRYELGRSLQEMLPRRGTLEEAALMKIVLPIIAGLSQVHERGFIHRDIKPANIFIREDGSPVLIDFGSAREALNRNTRTLTSLVSPGYAPFEQYYSKSDRQGPWTDIYALGATLYRAAIGTSPADAVDRSEGIINHADPYISALEAGQGRYSRRFLEAIDRALLFRESQRPQTLMQWAQMFEAPEVDPEAATVFADPPGGAARPADPGASERETGPAPAATTVSEHTEPVPPGEGSVEALIDPAPDDLALLIGPRREYYQSRYQQFEDTGKRFFPSWHWPACLLSFVWLNYRKLYLWAWLGYPLAVLGCGFVLGTMASVLLYAGGEVPVKVSLPVILVLAFTLPGFFANTVYFRRLKGLQSKVGTLEFDEPQRRDWLTRRGGVSKPAAAVAAIITLVLAVGLLGSARKNTTIEEQADSKPRPPPVEWVTEDSPDTGALVAEDLPDTEALVAEELPDTEALEAEDRQDAEALVAAAREDIRNLRLSTPAGRNALEKLQRLKTQNPTHSEIPKLQAEIIEKYRQLGTSAARKGDLDQAAEYLQRAREIDPDNPQISDAWERLRLMELMAKGKQAAKAKDLGGATRYLRQAMQLDPDNTELKKLAKRLEKLLKHSKGKKKGKK